MAPLANRHRLNGPPIDRLSPPWHWTTGRARRPGQPDSPLVGFARPNTIAGAISISLPNSSNNNNNETDGLVVD
jgi:hypothetical protein